MYEPLEGFPGLHASADCGQPIGGLDNGAAEADGKLQSPADRYVWHNRQVRSKSTIFAFTFIYPGKVCV